MVLQSGHKYEARRIELGLENTRWKPRSWLLQGGELSVRWEHQDGKMAFTFRDSGTGFHRETLQHLFDLTFRTKPSCSGLGLAIVHRIVEDHQGDITAGNREPQGAWVRVPLREAEA